MTTENERDQWWSETPSPIALPSHGEVCEAGWTYADQTYAPCGEPAVGWRIDAEDEGHPWPVCESHLSPGWAHS